MSLPFSEACELEFFKVILFVHYHLGWYHMGLLLNPLHRQNIITQEDNIYTNMEATISMEDGIQLAEKRLSH